MSPSKQTSFLCKLPSFKYSPIARGNRSRHHLPATYLPDYHLCIHPRLPCDVHHISLHWEEGRVFWWMFESPLQLPDLAPAPWVLGKAASCQTLRITSHPWNILMMEHSKNSNAVSSLRTFPHQPPHVLIWKILCIAEESCCDHIPCFLSWIKI